MIVQVAKEHLGYLSKNPPTMIKPNSTSLSDPTYLHSLLQKVRAGEQCSPNMQYFRSGWA